MLKPMGNTEEIMKMAKRIGITILICIPIIFAFAYLTRRVITSNVAQVACFTAIMFVAVVGEELIARAIIKKKNSVKVENGKTDVFK